MLKNRASKVYDVLQLILCNVAKHYRARNAWHIKTISSILIISMNSVLKYEQFEGYFVVLGLIMPEIQ